MQSRCIYEYTYTWYISKSSNPSDISLCISSQTIFLTVDIMMQIHIRNPHTYIHTVTHTPFRMLSATDPFCSIENQAKCLYLLIGLISPYKNIPVRLLRVLTATSISSFCWPVLRNPRYTQPKWPETRWEVIVSHAINQFFLQDHVIQWVNSTAQNKRWSKAT